MALIHRAAFVWSRVEQSAIKRSITSSLLVVMAVTGVVGAEDWPQWRGPAADMAGRRAAVGVDSPFLAGREQTIAELVKTQGNNPSAANETLLQCLRSDDWPRMDVAAWAMASNNAFAVAGTQEMESTCLRLTQKGRWAEAAELLDAVPGIRQDLVIRLAQKMAPMLGSAETGVVVSACQLIAALGPGSQMHAPRLLELFKQANTEISWAAARALDAVGVPESITADTLASIIAVLGEGAYERQIGGLQILQRLGAKAAPALDRVKAVAARQDGCPAILAWDVLIAIGAPAVPAMAELLLPVNARDFRVINRLTELRRQDVTALVAEIERITSDKEELRKKVAPLLISVRQVEDRLRTTEL